MPPLRIAIPLLAAALLCACGQKGALFRPDQQRETVSSTDAAASPAPTAPAAGAAGATNAPVADPAAERERENAARNRN